MEGWKIRHYLTGATPLAVLSVVLSIALFMMSAAMQGSAYFGGLYSLLLVVNVLGVILLGALIVLNLRGLVRQLRARKLGSRLTLRLIGIFVLLTFVPVFVVYGFSLQLLNKGIDSWFDIKIEEALNDALSLGRAALGGVQDDMLAKTREMAADLEASKFREISLLDDLREQYGVAELTLFGADGKIVAFSSQRSLGETRSLVPERPHENIVNQVRRGMPYASVDAGDKGLQLRVVVPVYGREVGSPVRILQMLQPLGSRYSKLGESVQSAFLEYEKLMYLRKPLKYGFTLTLTLVALLSLLISVWASIFIASRLTAPIRELAEATRAVARGDYRKRLPISTHDEFGVLVSAFNDMTRKIQRAQSQTRRSQREAESQRTYLETVLAHLSSGVLSFDGRYHLRMHNASAARILDVDLEANEGQPLSWIANSYAHLSPFLQPIESAVRSGHEFWQAEAALMGPRGRRLLIQRGTLLPATDPRRRGCVVVFDDVTDLLQAQRDAAWGEVARRMAHEIKNPLTPIQLSAERIRRKFLNEVAPGQRETLDRATNTIIQQVDAMKSMVNEFADYARPVQASAEAVNLNQLVRDVIELHRAKNESVQMEFALDESLPMILAEPRRLRQVLHNLLLNAADAVNGVVEPLLDVRTRRIQEGRADFVELRVRDNGPGFAAAILDRVFEPYVTSKEKGTGLGLAIVKKIIEDHGGVVWVENLPGGGAAVTLRLPVLADTASTDQIKVHSA